MIKTEKLKQMLLNHEPIWCVGLGGSVFKIGNKKKDTERLLDYYTKKYSADNYYESEERAMWYINFENITKFEQISFPFWSEIEEDLKNHYGDYCLFEDKNITIDYFKEKENKNSKVKLILSNSDNLIIKTYDATLDGYKSCCEYAKNYFLNKGEI